MPHPEANFVLLPEHDQWPDYGNQRVFQRNRLPARAYYIPETALILNGIWDFQYASTPLEAPEPFCNKIRVGSGTESTLSVSLNTPDGSNLGSEAIINETQVNWSKISVPGHWKLQGHGRPQYTNVIYPFPVCPPHVPTENPTGTYRRTFTVSPAWEETSQLRIRFDGVDSSFHLWINGFPVGYHQGSRNASEFDITTFVKRDAINEVFVRVYQRCDGSYIEDQDQWWLSSTGFRSLFMNEANNISRHLQRCAPACFSGRSAD
jgi:beta-galactosidase